MTYPTQGFNPTVPIDIDGLLNGLVGDVVGRKDDTAVAVPDNVSSIIRYLKGILIDTSTTLEGKLDALTLVCAATSVGKLQIAATTIQLNLPAGLHDLFTGTTQDVVVEKLTIRIPVDVSAGACDSISIQTDDTTNQVFISAVTGVKANLKAQAQLGWTGVTLLKATKKIQLTIAGAATGIACLCDVICEYRAVVSGGLLV